MQRQHLHLAGAAILLLAFACAVYAPGLWGPFVFDDLSNILQVSGVRIDDLSLESLHQAWNARQFDALIGRPIAMLSFALNYYFTGFDVFYFKVTNLLIHLLVGISLYALVLRLLRRDRAANPYCPYQEHHLSWLALAITGVWLLHPLNLTSVLYVVQRMTSLAALFTVLGLLGYCLGREQIIQGKRLGMLTALASLAGFGLLGVLCKENAVLVLPLAVLIEIAFYRFTAHPTLATFFHRTWFGFVLVPLVLACTVILVQHERWFGPGAYQLRDFTLEERVLTQGRVIWFYLRLILLPDISRMGLYHDDFPLSQGLTDPVTTLISFIGIAGLIAAAVVARARFPVFFFAIGWFLIGHSLESTVFPLEMIHEHRNYLPQLGILFAVVYFVGAPYAALRRSQRWRLSFIGLFAALLAVTTVSRSLQWQDASTLYAREVLNHPESARAHTMLGVWAHQWGRNELARAQLELACALAPQRVENIIRLVQHVYTVEGRVPAEMLEQLRDRLAHGLVTDVALWVYEPLLQISRKDAHWHDQFIELYTLALSRPDIRFKKMRYEAGYRLLAENHAYRGRIALALKYYERARALHPRPYYDIMIAQLYADNACYDEAEERISRLRARRADIDESDRAQLHAVEKLLAQANSGKARCTL